MYFSFQNTNTPITPKREQPTEIGNKQVKMVRHYELFQGQDDMLSNLAPATVFDGDMKFSSVEQAYQFRKCVECWYMLIAAQVLASANGSEAKANTKGLLISSKWRSMRAEILYQLMWSKCENNTHIRQHIKALPLNTIFAKCVSNSFFWSCGLRKTEARDTPMCHWPGANIVGKMWHNIKREIHQSEAPITNSWR
jgi:predicted NAD-dependent protein-ADP-ribosyltransferase YbiA (DUF1768 family)